MGRFFGELIAGSGCMSAGRVDSIVASTLVFLEQTNDGSVSPEFEDFLRYVIKKAGSQKKSDLLLHAKHSRATRHVAA